MVFWFDWWDSRGKAIVSTKIGIITEGPIDDILLSALLERIARERANFTWPTMPDDLGQIIPLRKRGHGGVLDAVRRLVSYLEQVPPTDHAFFVVLLDRRTRPVQEKIRKLISGKDLFVPGIAIEEIEAWWLADRHNTLAWLGLRDEPPDTVRYWEESYNPEKDPDPKKTLDELTDIAQNVDQRYGQGNTELARQFATEYWQDSADLNTIERDCPKGFRPFCHHVTKALDREKKRQGRFFKSRAIDS